MTPWNLNCDKCGALVATGLSTRAETESALSEACRECGHAATAQEISAELVKFDIDFAIEEFERAAVSVHVSAMGIGTPEFMQSLRANKDAKRAALFNLLVGAPA
jgi:hypothetical protein